MDAGRLIRDLPGRIQAALEVLDPQDIDNVYAVSLLIHDEEDDPKLPTVTVDVNTEEQVRLAIDPPKGFVKPNPWWTPADEQEARWNYAFWRQAPLMIIADRSDQRGSELREKWFQEAGLPVNLDWDKLSDDEADGLERRLTQMFVDLVVATVQALHRSGVVETIFSRSIPLIIHELDYYDEIAEQNVRANGPELVAGLVEWIYQE